ncbi:ImmA/IrrE family metallo-endopeptidase [Plantibacter sp. YIM 135249]|uniref:ImmA/IrrE family metallo-endopeptidase n=1 Tax=Plantibacter sp. YIM 135249 TaxID=3423918 RepID=UPI003D347F7C
MTLALYEPQPEAFGGRMYGRDVMIDSSCMLDYDPWSHAEMLGVPIVPKAELPTPRMVACYSSRYNAIFVRHNLHGAVERCAIAHEIVHYEYNDIGTTKSQEDRADRISARRLIRPSRIEEFEGETEDPAVIALELNVTELVMRQYMRMLRQGFRHG